MDKVELSSLAPSREIHLTSSHGRTFSLHHCQRQWFQLLNQKEQNPEWFDRLLSGLRERIEGSFNELQNTGRNLERLLAKTVVGLSTRVIAKVTSYTLKQLLRNSFRLDVQTFQIAEA